MDIKNKIALIGIGNDFRGDDQLGIEVAKKLKLKKGLPVDIFFEQGNVATIIDVLERYDEVHIIDIAKVTQYEIGKYLYFDLSNNSLPENVVRNSTHIVSVSEAIEMARALNKLPQNVYIHSVVGKNFEIGTSMSIEVENEIPMIVNKIEAHLNDHFIK